MIQTTALRKISALRKRIKAVRGGQGSGKTISILWILCNHAWLKPNREILILSAELTKMRLTVIKDFVKVMRMLGMYDDARMIAGTLYRFPNGSFIKFIGLDKEDVGKGLRSDVCYFNEINKISPEAYRQVSTRSKQVFLDYNPDARFFVDDDVLTREDCDFIQLTFEDNEALPKEERDEILNYKHKGYNADGTVKNEYFANLWQVYGLGNIGSLSGAVFSNWSEIDSVPEEARLVGYGLDFGYTNDPTSVVAVYNWNGKRVVDEICYRSGMVNSDIAKVLPSEVVIYADSSEPKSIEEIRRFNKMIKGVTKGADSINFGIQVMQEQEYLITKRSINLIREMRSYIWDKDKAGNTINKPRGGNDHAIDALRYHEMESVGLKKNYGTYNIY